MSSEFHNWGWAQLSTFSAGLPGGKQASTAYSWEPGLKAFLSSLFHLPYFLTWTFFNPLPKKGLEPKSLSESCYHHRLNIFFIILVYFLVLSSCGVSTWSQSNWRYVTFAKCFLLLLGIYSYPISVSLPGPHSRSSNDQKSIFLTRFVPLWLFVSSQFEKNSPII